ncbi:MAG: hypothetical protein EZS28_042183 [Streblomastix strix]|uniref:Integrase SAM-like N-terminal domain-containing protein n=1 Tax=Streblomastix strix TaxID=222440 RepID=A0A5J4TW51_9EUKA|nr:MAG: hypothetical protein EZS28_042183 [Streblomastix strix]
MARETQKMIMEGQKFNTQKKYMQTMGVFDDWMKEKNCSIEDITNKKMPFTRTEFMTWLARTKKTKQSSSKYYAINSQYNDFSHIWDNMGVPGTLINCLSIGERDQKVISSRMKSYKQNQLHFQCRYAL